MLEQFVLLAFLASMVAQIAAALAEAHERRIVHRDLKPGNIAVTAKEQVKVLDFRLAKLLQPPGGGAPGESVTESVTAAQMVGRLPYMAPEQVEGERLDARTDIYGLGVVLYEMATGTRPSAYPEPAERFTLSQSRCAGTADGPPRRAELGLG